MTTLNEDQTTAILYATSQRVQHNGHVEQTYDPDKYDAFLAGCMHKDRKAGVVLQNVTADLAAYKVESERMLELLKLQAKLLEKNEAEKMEIRKQLSLAVTLLEEILTMNPMNQGDSLHIHGLVAQVLNQIKG